tara:strand:- start:314 stop:604 length:291 start_codon:yes stop_codon:yes gene_type:complete
LKHIWFSSEPQKLSTAVERRILIRAPDNCFPLENSELARKTKRSVNCGGDVAGLPESFQFLNPPKIPPLVPKRDQSASNRRIDGIQERTPTTYPFG